MWKQRDLSRIVVLVRVGRRTSDVREGIGVLENPREGPGSRSRSLGRVVSKPKKDMASAGRWEG